MNSIIPLIPYPKKISLQKSCLTLNISEIFILKTQSEQLNNILIEFINILDEYTKKDYIVNNISLKISDINQIKGIVLIIEDIEYLKRQAGDNYGESYYIKINTQKIEIKAPTIKGIFYGIQTFNQILIYYKKPSNIHCCEIYDWPDFHIRGFMHDVGRNFIPISRLKKDLEIMAKYKMNVFHWHLTENEAWRLQSEFYPQLNDPKFHKKTRDPGKYYTKEDVWDLIDFSNNNYIQIIPEIDMPGHSKCFKKAMKTTMNSRRGIKILKNILHEFFIEFSKNDFPIIHIGSDEVFIINEFKRRE